MPVDGLGWVEDIEELVVVLCHLFRFLFYHWKCFEGILEGVIRDCSKRDVHVDQFEDFFPNFTNLGHSVSMDTDYVQNLEKLTFLNVQKLDVGLLFLKCLLFGAEYDFGLILPPEKINEQHILPHDHHKPLLFIGMEFEQFSDGAFGPFHILEVALLHLTKGDPFVSFEAVC